MMLLVAGAAASPGCQSQEEATSEVELGLAGSSVGMVVDNATGNATVFNADTNTVLGTVSGLGSTALAAGDCSITADGTKGFFTRFNSSVSVVDLTTTPPSTARGPNPIGISNPGEDTALSPDGKFLLVCDGGTSVPISVIDVAMQTQISTFNTGTDCNSVDVCSDGSVLFTSSNTNRVRRLRLSGAGVLTDTGDSLIAAGIPNNVYCSPNAAAGIVVQRDNSSALSFKIPGLSPVSTRNLGSTVVSGAINHAGDRAYFRTVGSLSGFSFDQATGVLGAAPFFQVTVASANTFFGMDLMAVHPSDASLYVPQPGALRILNAITGAVTGSIVGGSMSQITGVCFGKAVATANHAPVAKCADRTVPADGTCQGSASVDDGSFDPDGDPINCTQAPSGPFGQGTTAVSLTCTDSHGASASCTATVAVADQAAPALSCPTDQTVECNDGKGGATATFTATASDNCDGNPTVACVPSSGSTFPLGTTVDVCSASDISGNTSNCSHNVTVVDTAPATVITTAPAPLWPPNHTYHRIDLDDCIGSIQDACDGTLDIASHARVSCCTSDEPDSGLGGGDTANDCVIVDGHSVDVRAERAGNGNGRVYTIHYTVTDDSSNTTDHTCTVAVPHSQNGGPAIDDGSQTTCR